MSIQCATIDRPSVAAAARKAVLVVEDEAAVARLFVKVLRSEHYEVVHAANGTEATRLLAHKSFDAIVTDIGMPHLNGIELLKVVRALDGNLPVVLVTGEPETDSAIEAVHLGALRYLVKPVEARELRDVVAEAIAAHDTEKEKSAALPLLTEARSRVTQHAAQKKRLAHALERLYMVYQPIVYPSADRVIGYEALVRTEDRSFRNAGELIDTAEEVDEVRSLGRKVRAAVAEDIAELPPDASVFVNLHPFELDDDELYLPSAPLARHASRVVYEITERACLNGIDSIGERLASLRALGFRMAVDDLGSGYAGLTSFVDIVPEFIKIDMALIRDVDQHACKQELVRSLASVCSKMEIELVCEGVETIEEACTLTSLGARLFQGFLFSTPQRSAYWKSSQTSVKRRR